MTRRSERRADDRALEAYDQTKRAAVPDAFMGAQPLDPSLTRSAVATGQGRARAQGDQTRAINNAWLSGIEQALDDDLGYPAEPAAPMAPVAPIAAPAVAAPAATQPRAGNPLGGKVVKDGDWSYSFLNNGDIVIVGAPPANQRAVNMRLKKGDKFYDAISERRPMGDVMRMPAMTFTADPARQPPAPAMLMPAMTFSAEPSKMTPAAAPLSDENSYEAMKRRYLEEAYRRRSPGSS